MQPLTSPTIASFFDRATYSYSHLLSATRTSGACRRGIDAGTQLRRRRPGEFSTDRRGCDDSTAYDPRPMTWPLRWILETHIHADHFSAGPYVQTQLGGKLGISNRVSSVQKQLGTEFPSAEPFPCDGSQFDVLLADGERLPLGGLTIEVLHTPGHTPACATFCCGNTAFVGDALFMPDFGTGRTDFPGGCANTLYKSIQRILALPKRTDLYLCHDYGHETRDGYSCLTSVADECRNNVHLQANADEAAFVAFREGRDAGLQVPALYHCAVPFNIRGAKTLSE